MKFTSKIVALGLTIQGETHDFKSMLNKVSAKQISENFAKSYPDLLEGAVITKLK